MHWKRMAALTQFSVAGENGQAAPQDVAAAEAIWAGGAAFLSLLSPLAHLWLLSVLLLAPPPLSAVSELVRERRESRNGGLKGSLKALRQYSPARAGGRHGV